MRKTNVFKKKIGYIEKCYVFRNKTLSQIKVVIIEIRGKFYDSHNTNDPLVASTSAG